MPMVRTPPVSLSITHKLRRDLRAQGNVDQGRHAPPHDGVSRWWITAASEIAAELGDLGEIDAQGCCCRARLEPCSGSGNQPWGCRG